MKSEIAVPSRGRVDIIMNRKLTLSWLQYADYPVSLWVNENEVEDYKPVSAKYNVTLKTHTNNNISRIRDVILEDAHRRGVEALGIFDDDLVFCFREFYYDSNKEFHFVERGKIPVLPLEDINKALLPLFSNVKESVPMVGLRHRVFSHTTKTAWDWDKRIMWTPVLHVPTIVGKGFKYEWDGDILEDFHMQLSLLRAGYHTGTMNVFVASDALAAGTPTGCNLYRDISLRNRAAFLLEKEFPECVKLKDKIDPLTGEYYKGVSIRFSAVFKHSK